MPKTSKVKKKVSKVKTKTIKKPKIKSIAKPKVKSIAKPILRHRIVKNYKAESQGLTVDDIIDNIL